MGFNNNNNKNEVFQVIPPAPVPSLRRLGSWVLQELAQKGNFIWGIILWPDEERRWSRGRLRGGGWPR